MKKFVAGAAAGICALSLAVIPLFLDSTVFLRLRWKAISLCLALLAIVCTILQARWTKADEEAEAREQKRLLELIQRILRRQEEILRNQQERGSERERRAARRRWQAANCAADLLETLTESPPDVKEFYPGKDWRLFESLRTALDVQPEAFDQGQLLQTLPREIVLGDVERLAMLATAPDPEDQV